jgi:hypothetical protein
MYCGAWPGNLRLENIRLRANKQTSKKASNDSMTSMHVHIQSFTCMASRVALACLFHKNLPGTQRVASGQSHACLFLAALSEMVGAWCGMR